MTVNRRAALAAPALLVGGTQVGLVLVALASTVWRGGASMASGAADIDGDIPSRSDDDFLAICMRFRVRRGSDGADVFPDVHPGVVNHIRSAVGDEDGPLRCPPLARQRAIQPDAHPDQSDSAAQQPISGRS